MRTTFKLAPLRGAFQKLHVPGALGAARRALSKTERLSARPLRGLDGWSDQAEVAFYEEAACRRA